MSSQTFVPDRSKPNPHRRPLANRQTTLRKITFVRNWETNSPLRPYSFNLESILESPERAASLSPVPVVVAHPSPVYSSEEDVEGDDGERPSINDADDEEEDEVIPETQDQYRGQRRGGPIDFSEEDVIPDSQTVVLETPVSKRTSSVRNSAKKSKTKTPTRQSSRKKAPPSQEKADPPSATRKSARLSAKETEKPSKPSQSLRKKSTSNKYQRSPPSADISKFIEGKSSTKSSRNSQRSKDNSAQDGSTSVARLSGGLDLDEEVVQREDTGQGDPGQDPQGDVTQDPPADDGHNPRIEVGLNLQDDLVQDLHPAQDGLDPQLESGPDQDDEGSLSGSGPEHIPNRSKQRDPDELSRVDDPSLFHAERESDTATPRLSVGETTRNSFRLMSVLEIPRSGPVIRTKRRIPSGSRNKAISTPKKTRQEKDPDGCPVRLWQDGMEMRRVSEVIDLDVILNCFEETAWEMRHQYESMTLKKALNVFAKKTQEDLRDTISTASSIDKQRRSVQRSSVRLAKVKKELMEAQRQYLQLKNDVAGLKMRESQAKKV